MVSIPNSIVMSYTSFLSLSISWREESTHFVIPWLRLSYNELELSVQLLVVKICITETILSFEHRKKGFYPSGLNWPWLNLEQHLLKGFVKKLGFVLTKLIVFSSLFPCNQSKQSSSSDLERFAGLFQLWASFQKSERGHEKQKAGAKSVIGLGVSLCTRVSEWKLEASNVILQKTKVDDLTLFCSPICHLCTYKDHVFSEELKLESLFKDTTRDALQARKIVICLQS